MEDILVGYEEIRQTQTPLVGPDRRGNDPGPTPPPPCYLVSGPVLSSVESVEEESINRRCGIFQSRCRSRSMQKSASNLAPIHKVKFLCSFGGKIQPIPIWNRLVYSGGDSKILTVDRNVKLEELIGKIVSVCRITKGSVSVKYQLPGKDLSALISLTSDHDLQNLMLEYDRIHRDFSSSATVRIRLIIEVTATILLNSGSSSALNPDYLFGFDKESDYDIVRDDRELEQWKIPRAGDHQQITKRESDEQIDGYKGTAGDDVAVQSQKSDGHVKSDDSGLSMPQQQVLYWLPGSLPLLTPQIEFGRSANGCGYYWSKSPVYVFVPPTTVSRSRLE